MGPYRIREPILKLHSTNEEYILLFYGRHKQLRMKFVASCVGNNYQFVWHLSFGYVFYLLKLTEVLGSLLSVVGILLFFVFVCLFTHIVSPLSCWKWSREWSLKGIWSKIFPVGSRCGGNGMDVFVFVASRVCDNTEFWYGQSSVNNRTENGQRWVWWCTDLSELGPCWCGSTLKVNFLLNISLWHDMKTKGVPNLCLCGLVEGFISSP